MAVLIKNLFNYISIKYNDIIFICGSDEHGAAITLRAKKENKSPREIIDFFHELNQNSFKDLNIEFDKYDRTSSDIHHKTASDFFKELYNKNVFIKKLFLSTDIFNDYSQTLINPS